MRSNVGFASKWNGRRVWSYRSKTVYSFIIIFFLLMMFGTVKILILEKFLDRAMMVDEEDFNSTVEAFMVESSRPW